MRRILLVEDDPDVRLLLGHVLLAEGYKVDTAAVFADANRLVNTRFYDLVVADVQLPDGSGLAIADEAQGRGMETLVITGAALQHPNEGLQRHEYIMKPVRPDELLRVINRRLGAMLA
jgi:DNA-binding response OmpR family regulator